MTKWIKPDPAKSKQRPIYRVSRLKSPLRSRPSKHLLYCGYSFKKAQRAYHSSSLFDTSDYPMAETVFEQLSPAGPDAASVSLIQSKITEAIELEDPGAKVIVVFDVCETNQNSGLIDNLHLKPVQGRITFPNAGKLGSDPHVTLTTPTWLEIAVLANRQLARTRNTVHVRLRGINFHETSAGKKIGKFIFDS